MSPTAADDVLASLTQQLQAEHGPVRCIETHISWVLLAGPYAYKLKKPVRFGFLDFSTAAARRHYCEEELRLNRRLAPALYIDVVAVTRGPDGPRLGGSGEAIDAVVRMHRMPEGALVGERLAADTLDRAALLAFARRLARFHRDAPRQPAQADFGSPQRVVRDAMSAVDALAKLVEAPACAALHAWFDAQGRQLAPALAARHAAGWVREVHGDLHLDNLVVLDGEVTAFDCIEFDDGLRWIDPMADLGYLLMDLQARGHAELAAATLDAYLEEGGDFDGLSVLRWYRVYRAVVRALVTTLRGGAGHATAGPSPGEYLALATRLGSPPRTGLAITHGLPGSGKSRLALALVERTGAVRLRSDVERKRLAGLAPLADSRAAGNLYTEAATDATYARLLSLARAAIGAGWPVVLDAAWLRRSQRAQARALAAELAVPFVVVDCEAPLPLLRARLAERSAHGGDPSEAGPEILELLAAQREPLTDDERQAAVSVRTDAPLDVDAIAGRWLDPAA